jgi:hypothetical protein
MKSKVRGPRNNWRAPFIFHQSSLSPPLSHLFYSCPGLSQRAGEKARRPRVEAQCLQLGIGKLSGRVVNYAVGLDDVVFMTVLPKSSTSMLFFNLIDSLSQLCVFYWD